MTRNELIQNDGYWRGNIEVLCYTYKGKRLEYELIKSILSMKKELIQSLNGSIRESVGLFCPECGSNKVTDFELHYGCVKCHALWAK